MCEAFFECDCGETAWRSVSDRPACRTCSRRVEPLIERVDGLHVTSTYTCCGRQWTRCYRLQRRCGAGHAMQPVADAKRAIGIIVGWCTACDTWSNELNGSLGGTVMCRGCKRSLPALAVCSMHKFNRWRAWLHDPIARNTLAAALVLRQAPAAAPRVCLATETAASP
jgi:hypothetical protein